MKASGTVYMSHNYSRNSIPIDKNIWNDPKPIFKDYSNCSNNSQSYKRKLRIDFLPNTKSISKRALYIFIHITSLISKVHPERHNARLILFSQSFSGRESQVETFVRRHATFSVGPQSLIWDAHH